MEWLARPELERRLQTCLQEWPLSSGRPFFVAYSGGSDSTALLAALVALEYPVHALHVDHGWHAQSPVWADFCVTRAHALGVPCTVLRLPPETIGEGPEDRARRGRYAVLAAQLQEGDLLLTAQHQQDQAETFFLQLLRGTGIAGLAAMPRQKPLGKGLLLRPLLQIPKKVLLDYLQKKNIPYLQDPANQDPRFDRVRVRQQLLPLLQELGWQHAVDSVARTAENLGDVHALVEDWFAIYWERHRAAFPQLRDESLSLHFLRELSPALQRMFLRGWLQKLQMPLPSQARLAVLQQALDSGVSQHIQWAGGACWLQGHTLYLWRSPDFTRNWSEGPWQSDEPLPFAGWECQLIPQLPLELSPDNGHQALTAEVSRENLCWRRRQPGEKIRMPSGQHRPLKKILLEAAVPPEWREHIPLLRDAHGHLLLIPGFYTAPWASAAPGSAALCFIRC
ncbi:tRNA lysidine(34) synthetase TilS [Acidithiobacillus montserratensis]|uniref:tRNA lysidine(34) synthetase TilS n=1 Tax=Acidithiobacillus montserratensis TaxID=2729135 RepID=A0ACD5HK04_9PROT|nr:tRNA lysidine(34) synthetase TilS [Acidithiobacillus montserratensis]MBN2680365.1 tRNA lysidine(34) synthetase TilS [Acidithiobacillaceae bacterium]MBU2747648.1 tRNA lysidine(34) synthetase TilS [Acidithiobacillus montserratensis]